MAPISNAVFATLLMNDAYLPGAMVLGHSLKDKHAKGKLVALIVVDKLSSNTISDLKTVYDEIVPVEQIFNKAPANLYLMNRPDLISAFTKIQLWKQTQYSRIVYIDADVVALQAPNELLTMETQFAAVPDIGWPDCFNSGVMVLNPNMPDYYALLALADRGISFDGADQGLLNTHFVDWERLSFNYNCTPSGNYQYVPAYRHFQSGIKLVHFIGRDKPWNLGRNTGYSAGAYGELLGRWWAVYDRHYRARETIYYEGNWQEKPKKVQDYVSGEQTLYLPAYQAPPPVPQSTPVGTPAVDSPGTAAEQPLGDHPTVEEQINKREYEPTPTSEQRRWSAPHADWEPARAPPPSDSKPEASNFPTQIYDFSEDVKLFQPPPKYPEAPKDMWYEVPKQVSPPVQPRQIFPWEAHRPKPTRVFPQANLPSPPMQSPIQQAVTRATNETVQSYGAEPVADPSFKDSNPSPQAPEAQQHEAEATRNSETQQQIAAQPQQPHTEAQPPPEPTFSSSNQEEPTSSKPLAPFEAPREAWVDPWEAFNQRTNAWDDIPEITEYVKAIQPRKKVPIQVLHHTPSETSPWRRESLIITDFPSETERPSLPVTPAPIRRPTFWGDEKDMSGELPNAEGVPKQDEWVRLFSSYPTPAFAAALPPFVHESNGILSFECQHCGKQNPFAKLDALQQQQSNLLERGDLQMIGEPPKRELPGSASREAVEAAVDKATSPTSARTLKPILKEPHFELEEEPNQSKTAAIANSGSDVIAPDEDVLSPGDTGESSSRTPTPTQKVVA